MSELDEDLNDPSLTELIVSRLVHEVIGPIGAIGNGMELLQEFEGQADAETLQLITDSASETNARLQFYRTAYGRAGYELVDLAQLRGIAAGFFAGSAHHELAWPLAPIMPSIRAGVGRVALILLEISKDCLPRGGVITVSISDNMIDVTASAPEAAIPDRLKTVLDGTSVMSAREAHAGLVKEYMEGGNMSFTGEGTEASVQFLVRY